jgi:hypothetical protein
LAGRRVTDAEDERPACVAALDGCAAALAAAAGAVAAAAAASASGAGSDAGDEDDEFAARLCDALSTHATMHLPADAGGRAAVLAGLMALTRHSALRVTAPSWGAWMALLRNAGAPAAGAMPPPGAAAGAVGTGTGQAQAWGCDLSYDYVKINVRQSLPPVCLYRVRLRLPVSDPALTPCRLTTRRESPGLLKAETHDTPDPRSVDYGGPAKRQRLCSNVCYPLRVREYSSSLVCLLRA